MQKCPVCPRCSGMFIAKEGGRQLKRPLLLHCGHTFCESCLQHLYRERKTGISCPICFAETTLPEGEAGVRSLHPDTYMIGMLVYSQKLLLEQELNKLSAGAPMRKRTHSGCSGSDNSELMFHKDKLCKECGKKQATSHCAKCDCNMCQQCFTKVHSLSNTLRQHQPLPLTEEGQLEVSQMCKIHENRPIEYYCEDDEMIICSRCVIVGNHKGHNISSIEDKNRLIVCEMEPNLQVANHVHRRLKKIDKELSSLVPDSKTEILPALEEVNKHFQYLHGLLQVREQALERQVLDVFRAGLDPIEKLRTNLQNEYKQLDLTIKAAHRVINNNDEIIVNAKEILDKLTHAKDIPCIVERNEVVNASEKISFLPGPSIDTVLLGYGDITGFVDKRFTMYTLRDRPEKFTEDTESLGSLTPTDCESVTSTTTSCSEDIIIEGEQDINLEDPMSLHSDDSSRDTGIVRSKAARQKSLPQKAKLRGHNENVFVTHIQHPRRFMVQLKSDVSKLTTLSYSMQQWCNSAKKSKHMVTGVDIDDLVLAQYSLDKQWYRARIKHVMLPDEDEEFDKTNVEIVYIDYGNTEVVPVNKLRNMQVKFMKHPEFAIECCLSNIVPVDKGGSWSSEATKTFAKMVESKPMLMNVVREENNIMQVDLCKPPDDEILDDRPMSVRDSLIFLGQAHLESPMSLPIPGGAPASKRNFLSPDPREEGQIVDVVVSYAGTPDCFYAQELGEESHYLANMMAQIQDMYRHLKDTWQILCPQIGMICVAQFSGDGLWYRAKIVDLPGKRDVVVQYVDYGNRERINIYKIQKIIDSFLVLPAQAMSCTLTDVDPPNVNEGWTDESLRWWSDMVFMKQFVLKVTGLGATLNVVLRDPDMDPSDTVNMRMVKEGQGQSVGKWSEVQSMTQLREMSEHVPRLSYQVGGGSYPEPCDIDQQPVYWKTRKPKPMRKYQETVLTPPSSPERPSEPPARPVIVEPEIPEPPRLVKKSPKSPSAAKTSPSPRKQPVGGVVGRLFETAISEARHQSSPSSPNKTGDVNSNRTTPRSTPTPPKSPNVQEEATVQTKKSSHKHKTSKHTKEHVEVCVSHFVSPSEFHVQMASAGQNGLDQLMIDLGNEYNNSEVSWVSWSKGGYCAAMSPSNGRWYRAKITKILQKNLMEVFMLDYGFTEIISTNSMRSILRQYRKQRCFSFRCHIAGLIPAGGMKEWSRTACEFMQDSIINKTLFISQQGNVENGSLPIDLIIEEYVEETALEPGRKTFYSLIEMMRERGLAIPIPKKRNEAPEEPKVYPTLYYKIAAAAVKTGDRVMPVYVDYDAVIHCYTMEGDDAFQSMCDTLDQKFKNSDPHGSEQSWVKGQAGAAFYEKDQQWHRCTVMALEPTRAQIHFIDYGNSEWVGYDQMRADIEEFVQIPQQTFLCILHDLRPATESGKWDLDTLEYMHKQLVNKYCTITVIEKNGYENEHMTVNLFLSGADFGSMLVQYGMARRGEYITDQELQSKQIDNMLKYNSPFTEMSPDPVGEMCPVLVTHVELPNVVYLQYMRIENTECMTEEERKRATLTNKYLNKLEQLSIDMNKVAPTLPGIPCPKNGLACCAQFGYDKCWYRAVIIDIYPDTKQLLVLFVDYGNSEIITVNKMRALPPSYLQLPCQSVRCTLADLEPPNKTLSWTKSSLMEMMAILANKPLLAKTMCHKPLTVELLESSSEGNEECLVYQSVIDVGYVKLALTQQDSHKGEEPSEVETKPDRDPTTSSEVQRKVADDTSAKSDEVNIKIELNTKTEDDTVVTDSATNATMATSDVNSGSGDDRSSASTIATTTGKTNSKSWADMAEEGSSVDLNELPDLDMDDEERPDTGISSDKKGKRKRQRNTERKKVESVIHDDECFD